MELSVGLVYGVVGVAIGVSAAYYAIKKAKPQAERDVVVRCILFLWASAALLIGLPLGLYIFGWISKRLYLLMLGLFFVLVTLTNAWAKRKLAKLRGFSTLLA